MAIQTKFLEQWIDAIDSFPVKSEFEEGQKMTLQILVSIANKTHPTFKTLKSFIKTLERGPIVPSTEPNVS